MHPFSFWALTHSPSPMSESMAVQDVPSSGTTWLRLVGNRPDLKASFQDCYIFVYVDQVPQPSVWKRPATVEGLEIL